MALWTFVGLYPQPILTFKVELTGIPTIAQLAVIHERKAVQNEKDLGKQLSLIESLLLAEEDAIATILANKYTVKLEPFVQGVTTDWEKLITNDLQDKLRRPGGPTLLAMIAEVFGSCKCRIQHT